MHLLLVTAVTMVKTNWILLLFTICFNTALIGKIVSYDKYLKSQVLK